MYDIKKIEKALEKVGYDIVNLWLNDPCYNLSEYEDVSNEDKKYLSDFEDVAFSTGANNISQVLFYMRLLNKLGISIEELEKEV